ncbi:hypothetical protein HJD18_08385 [Thermoleophilia bacterium SCSIO 60948]|nr:hypothetical protein HJD18_08385 [Thermoleophilia bacterium SCSIO 60948]
MLARRRFHALAAAVLIALPLAGCGEKQEPDPPEELSANALIAQGDDICERAREEVREATAQPVDDAAGNARLVGELISISQGELDSLSALEPPEELEAPMARYLTARQEALDLLRDARSAAEEDQAFEFARIQSEIADSQPERTRLAGEVGFETCSRVGDTADVEVAPNGGISPQDGDRRAPEGPQNDTGGGGINP